MRRDYVAADEAVDYARYAGGAKDVMTALCRDEDELYWNVYVDFLGHGAEDSTEFHFNAKFLDHMITKQEADWLAMGKRATFYVGAGDVDDNGEKVRLLVVASLQSSGLMTKNGNELLLVVAEELIGRNGDGEINVLKRQDDTLDSRADVLWYGHGGVIFGAVPDLETGYVTSKSVLRELVSGLYLKLDEDFTMMRVDMALPSYYMQSLMENVKKMCAMLEDEVVPSVAELYKVAGSIFKHLCRLGDYGCADMLSKLTLNHLTFGLERGEVKSNGEDDEKVMRALGL